MFGGGALNQPRPRRVLVVEDDEDHRLALVEALELAGFEVTAASNGRMALERMQALRPDLVLLDLVLPVMDGWEFRAAQKRNPALADTPVVAMSASASAAAAAVDADLYLRKPIDPLGLESAIEGVLRARERRLEPAHIAQGERMAALGTLAAGMAHEINNPLTYVLLHLRRMDRCLPELETPETRAKLEDLQAAVKSAIEGAERIQSITSGIRAFSRVDEELIGPVDLRAPLDSALELVRHEIHHRAKLVRSDGDAPPVRANEGRLAQVFLNLLTNAAQSFDDEGAAGNQIRVTTGTEEEGWVFAEISDTGCGIPDHILGHVFEPFFTTKPVGQGTGLGLSISHGIIRSLGGEIRVKSQVGAGTTFRVRLPPFSAATAPAPQPARPPAPPTPAPVTRRRRILVIDDEPQLCEALRRALADDHDVVALSSSPRALELLKGDRSFDAIVCDLHMPDLSGMTLYDEIARLGPELLERTIFMTAGAFTAAAHEFRGQALRPILDKPIDLDELRALLDS